MAKLVVAFVGMCLVCTCVLGGEVLMVADEFPALQFVAQKLKREAEISSQIVAQTEMPADLAKYSAVIVYIHKGLNEAPEKALIRYAEQGGKLILLHHSISSAKRANKYWLPFLGVSLPQGDVDAGGYKWIEPVTLQIVNLAPAHYVTTHEVKYEGTTAFRGGEARDGEKELPAFTLRESEVYLNHVLSGPRTVLLGLKYTDAKSGRTYMQAHAGWYKPAGKGWVFYLMPGHSIRDFENPAYGQMVVNAVTFKP